MKSLLTKLGGTKNEKVVVGTNPRETRAEDSQKETLPGGPPAPCVTCGSVIAWWDRYGGGPHCHRCRDWPSWGIVARVAAVVAGPAGAEGVTAWLTLWPSDAAGDQISAPGTPNVPCTHRWGRNRAVWPSIECDGKLVVNLDRWKEVEEFWECGGCGKWFSIEERNLGNG